MSDNLPAPQEATSVEDILRAAAPPPAITYKFTVPPSLVERQRREGFPVITSLALRLLTDRDEAMAAERAGSSSRLPPELSMAALAAVNDQPVTLANGSTDAIYTRAHPAIRALITQAFSKLHYPEGNEADSFLGSCSATAG